MPRCSRVYIFELTERDVFTERQRLIWATCLGIPETQLALENCKHSALIDPLALVFGAKRSCARGTSLTWLCEQGARTSCYLGKRFRIFFCTLVEFGGGSGCWLTWARCALLPLTSLNFHVWWILVSLLLFSCLKEILTEFSAALLFESILFIRELAEEVHLHYNMNPHVLRLFIKKSWDSRDS